MAVQRKSKKGKQNKSGSAQVIVVFWLVFAIVIIAIFLVNAQTIHKNFNLFIGHLTGRELPADESPEQLSDDNPAETVVQISPANLVQETPPPPRQPESSREEPAQSPQPDSAPAAQPQAEPRQQTAAPETRDRNIYFALINNDGQILQSRVTRRMPVSDSPMVDVLNTMLLGPSAEELSRGLLNLIPQNTRILSAIVRGSTAYISFSEDFLFNAFGIEGYIAQLRQIVWTVTEFSNVRDVQILVEGRRLDYLGEGIWIGSPINRQSF